MLANTSENEVKPFPNLTETILLVAYLLLAAAVDRRSLAGILFVLVGTVIITVSLVPDARPRTGELAKGQQQKAIVLAITVVLVLLGAPGVRSTFAADPIIAHLLPWGAMVGLWVLVAGRLSRRGATIGLAAILSLSLIISAWILYSIPEPHIDVWELHQQAADRLLDGKSPYSGLTVTDTSPLADPGRVIEGYPYPPLTAGLYASGAILGGDSRWTGIISWLVFLLALGLIGLRNEQMEHAEALALVLLAAAMPGWTLVLAFGWIEPTSLALLGLAVLWWEKWPLRSAILLGLAFATKQYFVLGGALLIASKVPNRAKRVGVAGIATVVTILPGFVGDPAGFWSWAVQSIWQLPARSDSTNLVGLVDALGVQWQPGRLLALIAPIALIFIIGPRLRGRRSFALGLATVLGTSFFLGPQAFPNYWFLVSGLVLLAVAAGNEKPRLNQPTAETNADGDPTDTLITR